MADLLARSDCGLLALRPPTPRELSQVLLPPLLFLLGAEQVSKGQFRRALDQAGLTAPAMSAPASELLTVKEVEVLSKRYEVKSNARRGGEGRVGGEAEVNYWKLCEQIEKVHFQTDNVFSVRTHSNCSLATCESLRLHRAVDLDGMSYCIHVPVPENKRRAAITPQRCESVEETRVDTSISQDKFQPTSSSSQTFAPVEVLN